MANWSYGWAKQPSHDGGFRGSQCNLIMDSCSFLCSMLSPTETHTTDTDTHTHTQRHRHTHRHTHISQTHTQRHRHTQTYTHTHKDTQIHTDTYTHRHRYTHTHTHTHTHTTNSPWGLSGTEANKTCTQTTLSWDRITCPRPLECANMGQFSDYNNHNTIYWGLNNTPSTFLTLYTFKSTFLKV